MVHPAFVHKFPRQGGAAPALVLGIIAVAIIIGVMLWLGGKDGEDAAETTAVTAAKPAAVEERPRPVAAVDMSTAEIEKVGGTDDGSSRKQKVERLFREGQTKRPFQDGFESEDVGREVALPHISAFDFGVLDGRVRIGVFGNGSIPKYTTRHSGSEYIIEMPGAYRFFRKLDRELLVDAYRVGTARLEQESDKLRIRITTTPPLEHEPYVIEDTYGLMLAFEPRRGN